MLPYLLLYFTAGQPFVLNTQSVDKQNIGDQCFSQQIQCDAKYEFRYLDGKCNNLKHLPWGMTNHTIVRLLPAAYAMSTYLIFFKYH